HDHAVGAVAALRRLFGDERALYRVGVLGRPEAFERGDIASGGAAYGELARPGRGFVDQHRACAALPEAASELRTMERQRSEKRIEQRLRWIPAVDRYRLAVEAKRISRHGGDSTPAAPDCAWQTARFSATPQRADGRGRGVSSSTQDGTRDGTRS